MSGQYFAGLNVTNMPTPAEALVGFVTDRELLNLDLIKGLDEDDAADVLRDIVTNDDGELDGYWDWVARSLNRRMGWTTEAVDSGCGDILIGLRPYTFFPWENVNPDRSITREELERELRTEMAALYSYDTSLHKPSAEKIPFSVFWKTHDRGDD